MAAEEALTAAVRNGERRALARAITLVESTREDHRQEALGLLDTLAADAGNSIRIGITGIPGVGKSTFIEALGNHVIAQRHKLAVLTVDPSSALGGGSILGDKTRMETLARNEHAFIRPSPSSGTLGGVARRTREAILLCEAAGFDVIIVETVGVGQSETAVADMTDMFLLLLVPGGGDELQGIKRGIVELADLLLVNKADGELRAAAERTVADYTNALRLLRPRSKNWPVPVTACSATTGEGIDAAWSQIERYRHTLTDSGEIARRRSVQAQAWLWSEISAELLASFKRDPNVAAKISALEAAVTQGDLTPPTAARQLLDRFAARD